MFDIYASALSSFQYPLGVEKYILCWYGKTWVHFEHSKHTEQSLMEHAQYLLIHFMKPHRTWPVSTETFHEAHIQEKNWMEVIRFRPEDSGSKMKGRTRQWAPLLPGSAALAPAPSQCCRAKAGLSPWSREGVWWTVLRTPDLGNKLEDIYFKDMYVILILDLYYSCTGVPVSDFVSIQTKTNVKILKVLKETNQFL